MLKLFLALLFSCATLSAQTIYATYHVEYGIIGKVADVNVTYSNDGREYRIDAFVSAYGYLANLMTHHLREHHISIGRVKKGMLYTDRYEMHKQYGAYRSTTIYRNNYKRAVLVRSYRRDKKGKKEFFSTVRLPYFSHHDLLTFFLNLPKVTREMKPGACRRFKVTGADRKRGRVDFCLPSPSQEKRYEKLLGITQTKHPSLTFAKVIMHRKLYSSRQGELEIAIDRQGVVHKAVLEDVLFFGDVRIVLDSFRALQ